MSDYSDLVLSFSPTTYWALDADTAGTDLSGNSHSATPTGATIGAHSATYPPILGADPSCTDLDGVDDFITESTGYNWANIAAHSILWWIYRDDTTSAREYILGGDGGGNLRLSPAGIDDNWNYNHGASHIFVNNTVQGSWLFVALVVDNTADYASIYVNAVANANNPVAGPDDPEVGNFRVGAQNSSGGNPFNGKMAHVAVVPSVLSQADIDQLYDYAINGAPVPSAYSTLLLSLSPSLYWPLDAVDGATDQSGNGRNGTADGPTIGAHTATYPPILGADASCTDLDGVDDSVESTYAPYVNATVRTFLGWAYRDNFFGDQTLFSGTGDAAFLNIRIDNETTDVTAFTSFGTRALWPAAWPGDTEWVFIAVVFDESGDTATLYINGELVGADTESTAYGATAGYFKIGEERSSGFGGRQWNGRMAHVAVFESGLTAQNIADLYDYALNGAPPPPVIPDIVSAPALA